MDHVGSIEQLVDIERRIDVNSFVYHGVHIWPMVRLLVWAHLMGPERNGNRHPTGRFRLTRPVFDSQCLPTLQWASGRFDGVFFGRPTDYQIKIEGKFVNRFADPVVEEFWAEVPLLKLELQNNATLLKEPKALAPLLLECNVQSREVPFSRAYRLPGYEDLEQVIEDVTGYGLDEMLVSEQIYQALQYGAWFQRVLSELGAKIVFIACYYHAVGMGLALACRNLDIPCVEYQHGKQGTHHGLYSHWANLPPEGYKLVPQWFWNWGEESKENIARWFPKRHQTHRTIVGGNLWLSRFVRGLSDEDSVQARALDQLCAGRKVILVSLQPVSDPVPDFLRQAIAQSPDDWLWLVRGHPLHMNKLRPCLEELRQENMGKLEFELASEVLLLSLLKRGHHHLTAFSSVCYEALAFDLGTTIFSENGRILYPTYIDAGVFEYADTPEDVLCSVQRGLEGKFATEIQPYIVKDPTTAVRALASILNGSS